MVSLLVGRPPRGPRLGLDDRVADDGTLPRSAASDSTVIVPPAVSFHPATVMTDSESDSASIRRRNAMKALGGLGTVGLLSGCSTNLDVLSGDDERPNVVFVHSDDHRYDFMSFTNAPGTPDFLETPNM